MRSAVLLDLKQGVAGIFRLLALEVVFRRYERDQLSRVAGHAVKDDARDALLAIEIIGQRSGQVVRRASIGRSARNARASRVFFSVTWTFPPGSFGSGIQWTPS